MDIDIKGPGQHSHGNSIATKLCTKLYILFVVGYQQKG